MMKAHINAHIDKTTETNKAVGIMLKLWGQILVTRSLSFKKL